MKDRDWGWHCESKAFILGCGYVIGYFVFYLEVQLVLFCSVLKLFCSMIFAVFIVLARSMMCFLYLGCYFLEIESVVGTVNATRLFGRVVTLLVTLYYIWRFSEYDFVLC